MSICQIFFHYHMQFNCEVHIVTYFSRFFHISAKHKFLEWLLSQRAYSFNKTLIPFLKILDVTFTNFISIYIARKEHLISALSQCIFSALFPSLLSLKVYTKVALEVKLYWKLNFLLMLQKRQYGNACTNLTFYLFCITLCDNPRFILSSLIILMQCGLLC